MLLEEFDKFPLSGNPVFYQLKKMRYLMCEYGYEEAEKVSSFGLELIFETIIPVQVTTTTQRYIPIPNAHVR